MELIPQTALVEKRNGREGLILYLMKIVIHNNKLNIYLSKDIN